MGSDRGSFEVVSGKIPPICCVVFCDFLAEHITIKQPATPRPLFKDVLDAMRHHGGNGLGIPGVGLGATKPTCLARLAAWPPEPDRDQALDGVADWWKFDSKLDDRA